MTVGDSKAAMMIKHPALAPSPQPRPAPTVRALPAELAVQRGPFWMPIRGPNPTPIDSLDLAFLIDAEDKGSVRRGQVKADDIAYLVDEQWIARQLESLATVRLQAERRPHSADRGVGKASFRGH